MNGDRIVNRRKYRSPAAWHTARLQCNAMQCNAVLVHYTNATEMESYCVKIVARRRQTTDSVSTSDHIYCHTNQYARWTHKIAYAAPAKRTWKINEQTDKQTNERNRFLWVTEGLSVAHVSIKKMNVYELHPSPVNSIYCNNPYRIATEH